MCFYLNREVQLRKAEFVIQPYLTWIVAIPHRLISDASNKNNATGIQRIACPRSLWNSDIEDVLPDPNFFFEENKGVLVLKKGSSWRTSQNLPTTNGSLWSKFLWH